MILTKIIFILHLWCGGAMMIIDKDIIYVPLFDQKQGYMTDKFTDIEIHARYSAYGEYMYDVFFSLLQKYDSNLTIYKYNMAFGAFKEDKLIGFVNGYIEEDNEINLDSLFVEPEYQRKFGVGTHLLSKFEDAAFLVSAKVHSTSLNGARSFYEKHGYNLSLYTNRIDKQLKMPLIGVVPVFHWYKNLRIKSNVIADDKWLRKNINRPICVYIGETHEIDGVGALGKNNEEHIWVNQSKGNFLAESYKKELERYLKRCR